MKWLRDILDKVEPEFKDGGRLERFSPIYEATDTILFSSDERIESGPHIRDNMDIKRVMFFVVIALIPCYLFGAYNIGYLNAMAPDVSRSMFENFIFGMSYVLPILIITFISGAICELTFSVIRRHEVNEGFLVTLSLIHI